MNAAFLLVTSAMLVGQGGDKKTEPAPAPKTAAAAASCGHDPCGCDGFGHRLRDRLRGLFSRDCRDACKPTTCCDKQRTQIFQRNCNDACRPKILNFQPGCHQHNHCAPKTCNDPCNRAGLQVLERLRGAFQRGDRCCDGGTSKATAGDKVKEAPKKMPDTPKGTDKKPQDVRIDTPAAPIAPTAIPTTQSIPSIDVTPAPSTTPIPAPRVEGERRDPF